MLTFSKISMQLIKELKSQGQDFEFYPTTVEILDCLRDHETEDKWSRHRTASSVLDIGAGNGKVLNYFRENNIAYNLFAFEKSKRLIEELPADVVVLGCDFWQQCLFDKNVDIVFCNPPYSEFEAWAEKIIRESPSQFNYLVIPSRWTKSDKIRDAIKYRGAEDEVLGSFSFEDAEDRKARAKVDLIKIRIPSHGSDPFDLFFDTEFSQFKNGKIPDEIEKVKKEAEIKNELIAGGDLVLILSELYQKELANIQSNYSKLGELDSSLLAELDISVEMIRKCLKERLQTTKTKYWKELFNNLEKIKARLTNSSRDSMFNSLLNRTYIDFEPSNIYAVVLWVIKNSNQFIEKQFIETYESLINKANVVNYKSNQAVFVDDRWRYKEEPSQNSRYGLAWDRRVVADRCGGLSASDYSWGSRDGLEIRAYQFIEDLLTIANNLGFSTDTNFTFHGGVNIFKYEDKDLFKVRAFKNRNMHFQFAREFMLAINVEYGRLKGWIKSPKEAAKEIDPDAAQYFDTQFKLETKFGEFPLLCSH